MKKKLMQMLQLLVVFILFIYGTPMIPFLGWQRTEEILNEILLKIFSEDKLIFK